MIGRADERSRTPSAVWGTAAAFSACLVGIGLARFAYTPLIPALIAAEWFSPAQAAYLGAANLGGYLVGAVAARHLAARLPAARVLRGMMLLATGAFFGLRHAAVLPLVLPLALPGWPGRRHLMVLAPPTVLPQVPAARRGLAGGLIFTGVGSASPRRGLWCRSSCARAWSPRGVGWAPSPSSSPRWYGADGRGLGGAPAALPRPAAVSGGARWTRLALVALVVEYGLNAMGLVPHMVFLVDYVARDLGQASPPALRTGWCSAWARSWDPAAAGAAGDRVGFGPALRLSLLVQAAAVGVLALTADPAALAMSSFVVGAFVPGCSTLVLGRVRELLADDPVAQTAAWSRATVAFALGLAAAATASPLSLRARAATRCSSGSAAPSCSAPSFSISR